VNAQIRPLDPTLAQTLIDEAQSIINALSSVADSLCEVSRAIALWVLGVSAWFFFRQMKLSPLAVVLGG
jgi:hypothetical protein